MVFIGHNALAQQAKQSRRRDGSGACAPLTPVGCNWQQGDYSG